MPRSPFIAPAAFSLPTTLAPLAAVASFAASLLALAPDARADSPPRLDPPDAHGPSAPASAFPSHRFGLAPRAPAAQLGFHYGLTQPLVLHGFNAAIDLRLGRFVASYSHGQGLEYSRAPGALTPAERRAGLRIVAPYSTGAGLGFTLLDELYVMADVKVHRFELYAGEGLSHYTTVTVGGEVGWRFFIWKGLHVTPTLRFWPNVWHDAPAGGVRVRTRDGGELRHAPLSQGENGFFGNILVGWAFNL